MAKRFTDLNELTTPASDDQLAIVDTSANETKRISLLNMLSNFVDAVHLKANSVITTKLINGAVTTPKFKPSSFTYVVASQANQSTTSGTATNITNFNYNYTTGATPERVFFWVQGMFLYSGGGSGQIRVLVNSDVLPNYAAYSNDTDRWVRFCKMYVYDAPANTLLAIQAQHFVEVNGTITTHMGAQYRPSINGFSIYNGA